MVRQQQGSLQESSIRDVYVRGIYALDVDRVQFIIASYLRTRLGKVRHVPHSSLMCVSRV